MHLIILPGNSKEYNGQWLDDSANAYAELFDSVTKHVFKHWETGEEMINTELEVERLKKMVKDINGEYVIFAKSAGTIVSVAAIGKGVVKPTKCVFVGSPWDKFANEQMGFNTVLKNYKTPTLFIQQTDDMFFKYNELKKVLGENLKNYKLIEMPGNNHAYDNYDEIKQWVREFL